MAKKILYSKSLYVLLLIIAIIAASAYLVGVLIRQTSPIEITKEVCEKAGGYWNECGSPCTGLGSDGCIQMCVKQCECGGLAGFSCPGGYKCRLSGKIADEMSVCIK